MQKYSIVKSKSLTAYRLQGVGNMHLFLISLFPLLAFIALTLGNTMSAVIALSLGAIASYVVAKPEKEISKWVMEFF